MLISEDLKGKFFELISYALIFVMCFGGGLWVVYPDEYKGVKYSILAENSRYITIQINEDSRAFKDAKSYIDYILSAEIEYNIEFVTIVSGEVLMFKKLKRDK